MMLEICLLTDIKNTMGGIYSEDIVNQKFEEAKKIYSTAIDQVIGINIFDLIYNMIKTDRKERYDLRQTIEYAEEMY